MNHYTRRFFIDNSANSNESNQSCKDYASSGPAGFCASNSAVNRAPTGSVVPPIGVQRGASGNPGLPGSLFWHFSLRVCPAPSIQQCSASTLGDHFLRPPDRESPGLCPSTMTGALTKRQAFDNQLANSARAAASKRPYPGAFSWRKYPRNLQVCGSGKCR
jgi:hypothetical protein